MFHRSFGRELLNPRRSFFSFSSFHTCALNVFQRAIKRRCRALVSHVEKKKKKKKQQILQKSSVSPSPAARRGQISLSRSLIRVITAST